MTIVELLWLGTPVPGDVSSSFEKNAEGGRTESQIEVEDSKVGGLDRAEMNPHDPPLLVVQQRPIVTLFRVDVVRVRAGEKLSLQSGVCRCADLGHGGNVVGVHLVDVGESEKSHCQQGDLLHGDFEQGEHFRRDVNPRQICEPALVPDGDELSGEPLRSPWSPR